jgi:hypothetical protein
VDFVYPPIDHLVIGGYISVVKTTNAERKGRTMTTATKLYNRAPKGGMVSSVNGRFYKGGQFVPAATVTAVWVVRPMTFEGKRRFRAIAKDLVSGGEYFAGTREGFASVAATRDFIAKRYNGGRTFPRIDAPGTERPRTINVAEIDRIRFLHRGC